MAINTTPNLHLPQWTPNEKPSYLVDFNQAFAAIDTGFAGVKEGSDGAMQIATNAYSQATGALQTANQAQTGVDRITAGLEYSVINLPTAPGPNIAQITATMVYSISGATIVLSINSKQTTTTTDKVVGTFTIPANINITGVNNLVKYTNIILTELGITSELTFSSQDNKLVTITYNPEQAERIPPNWNFQCIITAFGTLSHRSNDIQYQVLESI